MFLLRRAAGLAVVAAVLAAAPAVSAEPPPNPHSLELARKLFSEMEMDQLMSSMIRQMTPSMIDQVRRSSPNITDDQVRAITEAVTESLADLTPKIVDKFAPLYAQTFTEKELQDLVDFYDSPSGKAMIAKLPGMMAKVGPLMNDLMPEMTADMTRHLCSKIDCTKMNGPTRQPKT